MKKKMWICLMLLLVVPALLLTTSCTTTSTQKESAAAGSTMDADSAAKAKAAADRAKADEEAAARRRAEEEAARIEAQKLRAEEAKRDAMANAKMFVNEDVYFDFDSSTISAPAQDVLRRKAQYLEANAGANIAIEGHCDDRGTNEYNLALGERRAESAKMFLMDLGIAASRLNTISYGEEHPVDSAQTEEGWAKNRRAHVILQ